MTFSVKRQTLMAMPRLLQLLLRTLVSAIQTHRALALENLALRQQVALLKSSVKRSRPSVSDRLFWVALARWWSDWRSALLVVTPDTVIRWHREGFRQYWHWRSRPRPRGRPRIDPQLRQLIRQMSQSNPLWGAPRIHGELLKLGLTVSQATVSKYMVRGRKPPSQTWRTLLDNHVRDLVSIDFFTVPTATFRILYVLVVLAHDRRRIVHVNVTANPTAQWTAQQIVEAFPFDTAPRYLLRDRDGVYGAQFRARVRSLDIEEVLTAPHSPWQSPYVERLIGSIRRECLNHVIVINERHLRRILRGYLAYYASFRTHLSLAKDAPKPRPVEPPEQGNVIKLPEVGGLHYRYSRRAA